MRFTALLVTIAAAAAGCASGSGSSSDKAKACTVDGVTVTFRADERAVLPPALTSCPPMLLCPSNRTLVSRAKPDGSAFDFHCVELLGKFDGKAVAFERRGDDTVFVRGQYRLEAPDGRWTCTHTASAATLSWRYSAEAFSKKLWGIELGKYRGTTDHDRHLGPRAHAVCPPVDEWAQAANNGFTIEPIGSLVEKGVVADVRFTP